MSAPVAPLDLARVGDPRLRERLDRVRELLAGRAVHVLAPSGTEGSTVIDFLLALGVGPITAHDLAPDAAAFAAAFHRTHPWLEEPARAAALRRLLGAPITLHYRGRYLEGIADAGLVVLPQSWFRHPENAPLRAVREQVPCTSMTRLFFEVAPGPVVGVTGTNGKFTVAMLVAEMVRQAGQAVVASGNDRTHVPALYALDRLTARTWLVLEVSNRQLVDLAPRGRDPRLDEVIYSPHIGVVTNLAPHHLDDHGSLEAYAAVKASLLARQGPGDHAVLNLDDPHTRAMVGVTAGTVSWFSAAEPVERGAWVAGGRLWVRPPDGPGGAPSAQGRPARPVLGLRDLPLPGPAMVANALAACAAAACAGVPVEAMAAVLRRFRGFPYRFAYAGTFGGVAAYEDSLATNPAAAAAAIRALDRPFLLIAGGWRRGATPQDFTPMVEALQASGLCKAVLLIGAAAPVLAAALDALPADRRPTVVRAGTLEAAVAEAARLAVEGDALLLSPGCESFDQFADYRERGDRFRALLPQLGPAAPDPDGGGDRRAPGKVTGN